MGLGPGSECDESNSALDSPWTRHRPVPLARDRQDPWEKSIAAVQWDQRRAGKTFWSNDKVPSAEKLTFPLPPSPPLDHTGVVGYCTVDFPSYATRQIHLEPSSDTSSEPSCPPVTPTGRPQTFPSDVMKPVRKSSYSPVA